MKKTVISLKDNDLFSPDKTFNCGQCFRFNFFDGYWRGAAGEDFFVFPQEQQRGKIEYYSAKGTDLSLFLDAQTSYNKINSFSFGGFSENVQSVIDNAVKISEGLRILKQDFWETLISFIISQNNNIPRIKKNITSICENFGEKVSFGEEEYYTFPTPEALFRAGEEGLKECRLGFRTKYILDACERTLSGEISEKELINLSDQDAKQRLMTIHGVGPKVASCVLLYGVHRLSQVPVDVWMKKVFKKYFDSDFVQLGEFGGILQQYLFYRERFIIEGKET